MTFFLGFFLNRPDTNSIESLFCRYAEDDPAAFEQLYKHLAPGLERYLGRRCGNRDEVAEVMQQVFLRLHQYRRRYNPDYAAWQWVYMIARTELISWHKKKKKHESEHEFSDFLSQTEHSDTKTLMKDELDQAFSDVDPEIRELLELKFMEERSFDEIAQVQGTKAQTLRQRSSRALKSLRERIVKMRGGEE